MMLRLTLISAVNKTVILNHRHIVAIVPNPQARGCEILTVPGVVYFVAESEDEIAANHCWSQQP